MLIVNFQKIKEMKKLDKNKIIDSITKSSHQKNEKQKNNEKISSLEIKEFKYQISNVENQLLTPFTESDDKQLNKFKLFNKREDIENVLTKIIRKIGNQKKKPLSPKRQLDIEISLNKINNIRESKFMILNYKKLKAMLRLNYRSMR